MFLHTVGNPEVTKCGRFSSSHSRAHSRDLLCRQ